VAAAQVLGGHPITSRFGSSAESPEGSALKQTEAAAPYPGAAIGAGANRVAALGEDLGQIDRAPEGEVIWSEDGYTVTLTPDGWLVWVNRGKAALYGRRVRATAEWVGELRGR
jgi:hypothetical protein